MLDKCIVLLMGLVLSACATTGQVNQAVEIDRISPEQLQKLVPPAVATVTLDELVLDAKQGLSAEAMIEKIKITQSRYALTSAQVVEWNHKGLPIAVLDYIQQSNELAKQNAIADEMNKRARERALAEKKLKRERDLARLNAYDPYWGMYYGRPWFGPRPYGWGHPYWGLGWGRHYGW
jgi:endo-alpha-1,4-polygalactosaminidase (GH114 family)